tara:strand:+ start:488 stop:763 length:276 start_codon:yes stop_codon:yes gene_type:complete
MTFRSDAMNNTDNTQHPAGLPIWIRAPKQGGLDHYCGLTRAKLYELATRGHIKSVSLKKHDQSRGTRLFNMESILKYIESMDTSMKMADDQ